jgi:hypothetical protein
LQETFFALARDGRLNKNAMPNFFQVSIIGLAHKDEIRLTSPPWIVKSIIYMILSPFGKLLGYKAYYKSAICPIFIDEYFSHLPDSDR